MSCFTKAIRITDSLISNVMKKALRVLWFTNTPSLATAKLGMPGYLGGWISSLEKEVSKCQDIKLGVAFPYMETSKDEFFIGDTQYFPLHLSMDGRKVAGLLKRWIHRVDSLNNIEIFNDVIKQFNPDIIHVFGSEKSFGLIGSNCKIPMILQIQGNLSVYIEKWFSGINYFDVLRYCRKKSLLKGYGIFHSYYLFRKWAIQEREIFKHCKHIIGRTDWDRRISRILSPMSKYYHCDELLREPFYTKQWKYSERSEKILISTISPVIYKGLETILKSANLIKGLKKVEFKWYVVGVKDSEEIVKISEGSTGLKFCNNNVIFRGSLPADELIEYLVNSDCYVHPSHIENSPNSVCEAMLIGTPVIATYAGGTSTIVQNGIEGILVQDGDHYVLAGAIMELIQSPGQMRVYSENARKRALERHNPQTVVSKILDIYHDVLKSD